MRKRPLAFVSILAILAIGAPALANQKRASKAAAASGRANPLMAASPLFYQAPPFDKIQDSDYAPAIEAGIRENAAEIAAIASNPEPPTFANTIEAMERSGELLTRAVKVFYNMEQSHTNPTLQKIKAEISPKLAAHQDAIYLNPRLYARVKSLYDRKETLGLDAEAKYLVERYNRYFVRAGAQLDPEAKKALMALNQEETKLKNEFSDRILDDTNVSAVVVADRTELAGLSDGDLAAAAETAKERKLSGKWVLTLQNTTQQPPLASLTNRALRERILQASVRRGQTGKNDTRAIVRRLAELRAQKAKLLGFPNYAAYVLDDQMARSPENAQKLLTDLVPAATAKARGEAARIQQLIDETRAGFRLGPADWNLYSEKVRQAEYDLDVAQVRPYFELERVLRDGAFFAANRLYGITLKERKDLPVYHPDVRVWEVFEADGKSLALFYGDFFARPTKGGGAWCDTFVDQSRLFGTRPVVVNNTNFVRPAPGQPALLSFDDVDTLFHEFGHALHALFQNVGYPTLANTPRDFVEFPSAFNEHWALEPTVFANFAKHHRTGEPMPRELVERIKKSRTFNQGYATTEYLASALLDLAWHALPPDAPQQDVEAFESAALERFRVALREVPPRYRTTYFSHIWDGSYAAGYYAYLWSEVLDNDAYAWFKEHGGMTRENGQRFRDLILSRGGTQDVAAMYRAFRGRDPEVGPLLEHRGLSAPAP